MSDETEAFNELDKIEDVDGSEPQSADDKAAPVSVVPPVPRIDRTHVEDVTPEDREFIRRVFSQVRDVDFRGPPPPPLKDVVGLDKKLQFLRDRVRQLEQDLARVGYIWSVKEHRVDVVDEIVAKKERERATAVKRYEQLKEQAAQSSASARSEISALKDRLAELTEAKGSLEDELQATGDELEETRTDLTRKLEREEREKASLIEDFRTKIAQAQDAFTQLRDRSGQQIAELEVQNKELNGELNETRDALADAETRGSTLQAAGEAKDQRIEELEAKLLEQQSAAEARENDLNAVVSKSRADVDSLEGKLGDLASRLETTEENADATENRLEQRVKELEAELHSVREDLDRARETVTEKERTLATVADEMKQGRAEREERIKELKELLALREDETANLRSELESAKSEVQAAKDDAEKLSLKLSTFESRVDESLEEPLDSDNSSSKVSEESSL